MHQKINVLILKVPGTNCDLETAHAFNQLGAYSTIVLLNDLINNKELLKKSDILVFPGGFSYGDDVSAGKIMANQILNHLKDEINEFLENKKLIIGICNGFQVLCKLGLLPGYKRWTQEVTLTENDSGKFECRWVNLKIPLNNSKIFQDAKQKKLYLPVAHAEGKFYCSREMLEKIIHDKLVVFRYETKRSINKPVYPENPNGSIDNIAGICDISGQVIGLMPHPERHISIYQTPDWTRIKRETCRSFFKEAIDYCHNLKNH